MCGTLVDSYTKFEEEEEDPAKGDAMAEASHYAFDRETSASPARENEFDEEEATLPPAVNTYAGAGDLDGVAHDADDTEPLSSAWADSQATNELSVQAPKSLEEGRGLRHTISQKR